MRHFQRYPANVNPLKFLTCWMACAAFLYDGYVVKNVCWSGMDWIALSSAGLMVVVSGLVSVTGPMSEMACWAVSDVSLRMEWTHEYPFLDRRGVGEVLMLDSLIARQTRLTISAADGPSSSSKWACEYSSSKCLVIIDCC